VFNDQNDKIFISLIIAANRQTLQKKIPEQTNTQVVCNPIESPKRALIDCFAKNKSKSATEKFLLKVKPVTEVFLFLRFQNH
jgi:hypothetical protein